MILQPSLEDLIRRCKAIELNFNFDNIQIEEGLDRFDKSIPHIPESKIIGLYYGHNLAAILGFSMNNSKIHINQIQGRRGKKGYKPLASLEWERALIRSVLEYGDLHCIESFTATSSILETPTGCNVQDSQRLIRRYDLPLKKEGFIFDPSSSLFEFNR